MENNEKVRLCKRPGNEQTVDRRASAHKLKMLRKQAGRTSRSPQDVRLTGYHFDTQINRRTGKPHEHKREIARRLAK